MKLDSNGNTLWQTNGNAGQGLGVTVSGDEVAVSGYARSFNWQTINFQYPGDNGNGLFPSVIRFNKSTGAIIANHYLTSPGATFDDAKRITSDTKGNYFIGGAFQYQLNVAGTTLTNLGGSNDFFLAKLGTDDCDFLGTDGFKDGALHFYPNPVRDHLYIELEQKVNYEVYSILGSKVLSGNLFPDSGIDVSGLEGGMYLVRLWDGTGKVRTFKFIKQ